MARGDRPPPFPPPSERVNKSDHSEGRPPVDTFLAPRGLRFSRTSASPSIPLSACHASSRARIESGAPKGVLREGGGRAKEVGGGQAAPYLLRSTSPPPACPPRIIEIQQPPGVPPLTCTPWHRPPGQVCMQVQVSLRDAREGAGAVPRTHLHRTCSALQVQVCGSGQGAARWGRGSRPERGGGELGGRQPWGGR